LAVYIIVTMKHGHTNIIFASLPSTIISAFTYYVRFALTINKLVSGVYLLFVHQLSPDHLL